MFLRNGVSLPLRSVIFRSFLEPFGFKSSIPRSSITVKTATSVVSSQLPSATMHLNYWLLFDPHYRIKFTCPKNSFGLSKILDLRISFQVKTPSCARRPLYVPSHPISALRDSKTTSPQRLNINNV